MFHVVYDSDSDEEDMKLWDVDKYKVCLQFLILWIIMYYFQMKMMCDIISQLVGFKPIPSPPSTPFPL